MVYDADKHAFKHYDSVATSNLDDARQISSALEPFLKGIILTSLHDVVQIKTFERK